jgi:hypothetical protein
MFKAMTTAGICTTRTSSGACEWVIVLCLMCGCATRIPEESTVAAKVEAFAAEDRSPVAVSTNYPNLIELGWSYDWRTEGIEYEEQPHKGPFWDVMNDLAAIEVFYRFVNDMWRLGR